jgi:hypothetical protein
VADDLLEQAVGDRDAAGHGEVRDHLPKQPLIFLSLFYSITKDSVVWISMPLKVD